MELDNTFIREVEIELGPSGKNTTLSILQLEEGECGCVLWDAGIVLLKYLITTKGRKHVMGKHVIELGAGTGAVGLAAKTVGAEMVLLTDLQKYIPLLVENIRQNIKCNLTAVDSAVNHISQKYKEILDAKIFSFEKGSVGAMTLEWGNQKDMAKTVNYLAQFAPTPVCILVADCVYYEDGVKLLVDTIVHLFKSLSEVEILCSFEHRETGNKKELLEMFLNLLKNLHNLVITYIPICEMHEVYRSNDISIIRISQ
uniref:Protein-lysine methyltransferase METTL21D-like n=1 Tax=Phallusia mammillata TaxID=59560 RepID=A0A6F9DXK8_9ASCI|nr:protein-lysine methyltransferase METTL21D-like [Phallusia mammillata]